MASGFWLWLLSQLHIGRYGPLPGAVIRRLRLQIPHHHHHRLTCSRPHLAEHDPVKQRPVFPVEGGQAPTPGACLREASQVVRERKASTASSPIGTRKRRMPSHS